VILFDSLFSEFGIQAEFVLGDRTFELALEKSGYRIVTDATGDERFKLFCEKYEYRCPRFGSEGNKLKVDFEKKTLDIQEFDPKSKQWKQVPGLELYALKVILVFFMY
jgi:hypothetical protein